MKFVLGLLLALAISSTVGLPARNPDDDAEYVNLPSGRSSSTVNEDVPNFKDFSGVIDTGSVFPVRNNPFSPFGGDNGGGFFDSISNLMTRLRESAAKWVPTFDVGDFDLDPSKGNTTSIVKVVNGHRVEVNETVYSNVDESGNSVYKVRVVNVRPLDSDEDAVATASQSDEDTEKGSSERVLQDTEKGSSEVRDKETSDNEINETYKSTESTTAMHETSTKIPFEFDDESAETTTSIPYGLEETDEVEDLIEDFETSDDYPKPEKKFTSKLELHDASVANGPLISPLQSELSEEDDDIYTGKLPYEWASLQEGHRNNENNDIDDYESIPIDLSNDIEINQMLADQGAPTNPDAEVFAVPEKNSQSSMELKTPHSDWHPIKSSSSSLYWPKRK